MSMTAIETLPGSDTDETTGRGRQRTLPASLGNWLIGLAVPPAHRPQRRSPISPPGGNRTAPRSIQAR